MRGTRFRAAGVSFATTLVIAGKYQRKPPLPFAPGTEATGVVIEADAACRRLKVGDEVVAVLDWGGLAEEVVAHEVNVFAKPKNVGFTEAIQLAISYPTSAGALTWRERPRRPEGSDAAGPCCCRRGRHGSRRDRQDPGGDSDCHGRRRAQAAFAKAHGADHVIDYSASDFREAVLKLTSGRGVDRVYDPVGGEVFTQSLRCLAVEGRICPIGFAGGVIPQVPANILLVKSIAVMGFNYGYYVGWSPHDARFEQAERTFALMERIRGWCEAGLCRPHVDRTFRLDEAPQAMRALLERNAVGRLAVVMM